MNYFKEPIGTNPKYPCGICNKNIAKNHRFIRCIICNYKIHRKCNNTDPNTYKHLTKSKEPQVCLKCKEETIPFQALDDQQFFATVNKGINRDIDDFSTLFPSDCLKAFFKEINTCCQNNNENDEGEQAEIDCKYSDIESFVVPNKENLSFFHLNIASLLKHKDELDTILSLLEFKFDFIGITETKIQKTSAPPIVIDREGYKYYSTPAEGIKGGSLIYISDKFDSKPRKDIDSIMYKPKQLESTFREIINKKGKNMIIGCIYRHPSMNLEEFNDITSEMLEKLRKENKQIYLMGDFNIDLLKIESDTNIATFFDNITSNLFVPHITLPTRITPKSKTLIDNIYSNSENFRLCKSGNLTLSISDHLAQFLIIPLESKFIPPKHNSYKRDMKNFDRENFILDFLSLDWKQILRLEEKDPNMSFSFLQENVNTLVDKYLP